MAAGDLSAWNGWCSSQLRIVLLGGRNSGKNSLGNLLLGKEEFVTRERTSCSRRLGVVAGRWLAVVDTPGWWCDFSARDTSELVKREIVSSVALCSPGPHVFLIAVKASSAFSERRRRAVEEHVALLGEEVWSHCMLILTSADKLKHNHAERCIERGGKALRWLADKCGRRSHSVDLSDDTATAELLREIHKLVTENGNAVYEMQGEILRATAEEKREVEERAQRRLLRVKQRRCVRRERLRPATEIRIVLLGAKGSGKTSALHTILGGRSRAPTSGRTARCQVGRGVVFGRELTVVDTPGWWMNYFCDESPVFDRREMVLSLSLCPPGPHVFLLVVRVDRAFTETYRRAAQEHLELISDRVWSRVLLLFSFGDWLGGTTTERYIESEGEPLRWLAEKCGNRYHVLNSRTKGDGFQVRELIGKLEEMMSGCHYEIERSVLDQLERRMRNDRERAEERLRTKERQRQTAKSLMEKLNPLPELRLVLVGGRTSGKSSCGNTILGRESFDTDTRTTCTSEKQASIGGKTVTVLDTPGRISMTSDLLMPSCALLLVINVSASFTDTLGKALEEQLDGGGARAWSRAAVLFSHGDWLGDTSVERRIESEGQPLQRLLDKCGNRYHVLDNEDRSDRAQVDDLMGTVEEMLAGERTGALRGGHHMWRSPSAAGEEPREPATVCGEDVKEVIGLSHQLPGDAPDSPAPTACPTLTSAVGSDAFHTVALRAGGARGGAGFTTVEGFLSHVAAALAGRREPRRPVIHLPLQLRVSLSHLRPSGEGSRLSSRHESMLVVSSHTQHRMLRDEEEEEEKEEKEEEVFSVHTLCHPALRERTLRKLSQCGGLQALIDQWGDSSLEELEAFIDSYFEMVWEQAMGSLQSPEEDSFSMEEDSIVREDEREKEVEEEELEEEEEEEVKEEEVLSSIDRKLSKLELLEEIRKDLGELRRSLECSWRAIEDLRHRSTPQNTQQQQHTGFN